ncbi:hypothetical protein HKCCA1065_09915 [Rhodobacterales bacterium HKCCA1065]|jgi:hypothetical protein|nr:hypothetical protein [Rhodobacterales bacterium HKCCA1058]MBF9056906.1 hypothetical protein [Rhodobacterales bacterium HKCCA1065]
MISEHERRPIGNVPRGRFFGPCSGRDLPVAFELFGEAVDRFTFCDLAYNDPHVTAKEAVPNGWALVSRIRGGDEAARGKTNWYSGNRPFRPSAAIEIWRRLDGSEAIVELRCDLAQDVLENHFASGSMAAFMHINDGTGEGGSDLWFLASPEEASRGMDRASRLLPELACRLANGAVVVTDAALTDVGFRSDASFELAGRRWEYICTFPNERLADRPLRVWRVVDISFV